MKPSRTFSSSRLAMKGTRETSGGSAWYARIFPAGPAPQGGFSKDRAPDKPENAPGADLLVLPLQHPKVTLYLAHGLSQLVSKLLN